MRKRLALTAFVLPLILFVQTAMAAKPAKRVPFSPDLSGPSNALGHTGVTVKIQTASVAKDGTISVRFTLVDADRNPLDRLGVATPGPVSLGFIAAYIPAGQTQYTSYTTTVLASTINNNPSQTQAAGDSGGTYTQNAIGDYTYVFKTKAPATFDGTLTHTIGMTAYRNLSEYGTFDEWLEVGNDTFTFVPNGGAVKTVRNVVNENACNNCHNPLYAHGGTRITTAVCILCHSPQTVNPDTQLTMDFKVLVHKIHMGANLPSVKAGTPYRVWHRGAWSDFSKIQFPQDIRNCTTCHAAGTAQADNWKTNPSAAACTSCHDDVTPSTGQNHPVVVTNDAQCSQCHVAKATTDFDASIPGAHVIPRYSTSLPGVVPTIMKIDNATPGNKATVTFQVQDKSGNAIDATKLSTVRVVLAGPNTDYGAGTAGIRVSETPNATTLTGSNGVYSYTMTNPVPAGATGSYTIAVLAANNVTLMPGTTKQTTAVDFALPSINYFSVDSSPVQPRRQVVATEKCAKCHVDLTFVHGGTRSNTQSCTMCHNPTLVDSSGATVNFAGQIHSIHRGENLTNPYVIANTNYQEVLFPGDLRDCTTCHLKGTYLPENIGAQAMVATTGGYTKTTAPIAAACQGCHDDKATASHALANTTVIGESCTACHAAGMGFSVDRVHQRIF